MYTIVFAFGMIQGVVYSEWQCKRLSDFGGLDSAATILSPHWTEDCREILRIRAALWEGRPIVVSETLNAEFYKELRMQYKAAKGWFRVGAPVQINNSVFDTDADDLCNHLYLNSQAVRKVFEFSSNYMGPEGMKKELPNLQKLFNLFKEPAMTGFMEYLVDLPRWAKMLSLEEELDHLVFEGAGPFYFKKDDYYSLHNDWNDNRAISFTFYITEDKPWTSRGGRFGWCGSDGSGINSEEVYGRVESSAVQWIPPSSNKMILFRIALDSLHFVEKVIEEPSHPRFSIQARYKFPKNFNGNDKLMDPWHRKVTQNVAPLEVPFKVRYGKMKMRSQMKPSAQEYEEL